MPYKSNAELPNAVKDNLPSGAQTTWRKAFNAALGQYDGDESTAAKVAWAAVKKSYTKKGDKWVKKEGVSDWHRITYSVPISTVKEILGEAKGGFNIHGTAINETITRNNVKYSAEELEPAAKTLINKPILKDHRNEVDAVIGKVKEAFFDKNSHSVQFTGQIMDSKIKEMIQDGRLDSVSIGARVNDLVEESNEEGDYVVAKGIEILELSVVPVPGDAHATFTQALSESYELKKKQESLEDDDEEFEDIEDVEEAKNLDGAKPQAEETQKEPELNKTEETVDPEDIEDQEKQKEEEAMEEEKLKQAEATLAEKEKELAELKSLLEKKEAVELESLKESYKKLAEEKKASAMDTEKLDKNALSLLIEQLNAIKVAEKVETKKEETKGVDISESKTEEKKVDLIVEKSLRGAAIYRMPGPKGELINRG